MRPTAAVLCLLVPMGIYGQCPVTHTPAQVQGSGGVEPAVSGFVPTRGIVTARTRTGFFVQMPGVAAPDASDAVFIDKVKAPPASAAVGNDVCLWGQVEPLQAGKEIAHVSQLTVMSVRNSLPAPVALTAGPGGFGRYQGMRVSVDALAVTAPGSAQILDHILVNRNLLPRVSRFVFAHSDADFPEVDRNDASRPERLSDHDAAVAYFFQ